MTPRRAARNAGAAHPHLAALWLVCSLMTAGASFGSAYQGPTVVSWLLGTVAVGLAVLTWVALLPDGGRADDDAGLEAGYRVLAEDRAASRDRPSPVLRANMARRAEPDDERDAIDEADAQREQAEDGRW